MERKHTNDTSTGRAPGRPLRVSDPATAPQAFGKAFKHLVHTAWRSGAHRHSPHFATAIEECVTPLGTPNDTRRTRTALAKRMAQVVCDNPHRTATAAASEILDHLLGLGWRIPNTAKLAERIVTEDADHSAAREGTARSHRARATFR